MKGIEDLKKFLQENEIEGYIVEFDKPVMSSEDARKLTSGKVVKSILLISDKGPILCILEGEKKIDFEKVKKLIDAKNIRLAKAKEVREITGYDIGALPPFAHNQKILTIIDRAVFNYEEIYCGGGSHYSLLKIHSQTLKKFADIIAPITS